MTKEQFEKLTAPRISTELQVMRDKLKDIERTAENVISELDYFNFSEFEKEFILNNNQFRQRKIRSDASCKTECTFDYSPFLKNFCILDEDDAEPGKISIAYITYIKKLLREGRIGTAINYNNSYLSLKKLRGDVHFREITPTYLAEYESWLRGQNVSKTTIRFYLRPLRTLFNEAIEEGIIKREKCYPFGRRKYQIPTSRNIKKSLDLDDIKKIYYYKFDPEMEREERARDYWLFSYFGNVMNSKDIAFLKYSNINGEYLIFERAKTERAMRSDPKPITVYLSGDMKEIIDRWGNQDKSSNNFIFPILEDCLSPLGQFERVQFLVRIINDGMKIIMEKLGIDKKVTTYVARHTFSTVMKRSGASTEYIQEALGHADIKTTENYLDSFGKEIKKEFANRLTSFKY